VIDQLRTNRLKQSLIAGMAALAMSALFLLTAASPARAGESDFCWGVTLAKNGQAGFSCEDPNYRYLTGVYGQGTQGHVCVGSLGSGEGLACSDDRSYGVYKGFSGAQALRAFIMNYDGSTANKVYGHTWWNDAPPPPPPSWHTGTNLGAFTADSPDIASMRSNRLDVFARGGTSSNLLTNWYPGTSWQGWSNLGGPLLASGPGAVSWGSERLDVVARASNGNLLHWWYDGLWHNENLGGNIVGDPDIAADGAGTLHIFARGTDDTLQHKWHAGGRWYGWESLGGTLASGPGAVTAGRVIHVVGKTPSNAVTHWWFDGTWHSGDNLGGSIVGDPDLSSWGSGRLDVFARGADNTLQHKWYTDSSGWSGWESLGGSLTSGPGAVSWGVNRIDVVARDVNGAVAHWWYG
jgi:hypothetical protein